MFMCTGGEEWTHLVCVMCTGGAETYVAYVHVKKHLAYAHTQAEVWKALQMECLFGCVSFSDAGD